MNDQEARDREMVPLKDVQPAMEKAEAALNSRIDELEGALKACHSTLTWIRREAEVSPNVGILAFARMPPMDNLISRVEKALEMK